MSKVWLITGASRSLGRAFTEAVLESGDRVVATARNPEQLVELEGRYSEKVRNVGQAHLTRVFKSVMGATPGQFRTAEVHG